MPTVCAKPPEVVTGTGQAATHTLKGSVQALVQVTASGGAVAEVREMEGAGDGHACHRCHDETGPRGQSRRKGQTSAQWLRPWTVDGFVAGKEGLVAKLSMWSGEPKDLSVTKANSTLEGWEGGKKDREPAGDGARVAEQSCSPDEAMQIQAGRGGVILSGTLARGSPWGL